MAKDFATYVAETADSVLNKKENEDKLKQALEELEAYLAESNKADTAAERPDFSNTPEYERLEYTEKSTDEIKAAAESTLDGYKNSSVSAIEKEMEELAKKLETERKNAELAAETKAETLETAYGTAKKEVDDDMLRRGLARSSIAVNKNTELSESKAKESARISAMLADAVTAVDNEIAGLSVKREKALSDFNIAYAAKLTEQILSLEAEQEKRKTEVIKYNNSLAEKAYQDQITAKETEASVYGKELSNKEKEQQLAQSGGTGKDEAAYRKMCELLDTLNPVDARALVMENPTFKDNLSDYYYYKLYDKYTR